MAVLHYIPDDEDPWGIVSAMTGRLVPGSFLALSHGSLDGRPAEDVAALEEKYENASSASAANRSRATITRFFDGFELVEPGLVKTTEWRSDDLERARPGGEWALAGVGRKP